MNEKETLEKRSIVEFMGIEPIKLGEKFTWNDSPFFYSTESTYEEVMNNIVNYVKYDTSWDWLMPCYKKISLHMNTLVLNDNQIAFHVLSLLQRAIKSVDIKEANYQLVELIKLYNKNK